MTALRFIAISSEEAAAYQSGEPDANGQAPERHISDGSGVPCRHCLEDVADGEPFLILSHRPFDEAQPYAEQGPIFVHAETCARYGNETGMPAMFRKRDRFLMRGYNADNRIIYGSGSMVETADLESEAKRLFEDPDVRYIHLRSGGYNCYQCRIERA